MKQSIKNSLYHFPRALLAIILNRFPAKRLFVIGVTGSDGKTTTTHIIYHILKSCGYKVAMVSTVAARIGDEDIDTGFHVTSPNPFTLQRLLKRIADSGFTHVVLEATSHGLDQHRLLGANVRVGVLTNISHEHLDYHKTYSSYVAAKAKLFRGASWAILNKDDKSYPLIRAYISKSAKVISYGIASNSIIKAKQIKMGENSSTFRVLWGRESELAEIPLPGIYNVQNSIAALGAAGIAGIKLKQSVLTLKTFPQVTGRLNLVHSKPRIYIDFAHTPNALQQVLKHLKKTKHKDSKLISVFGCAGERDFQKRPMMGRISASLCDLSIFTAEDPRSEDVNQILKEMIIGASKSKAKEISKESLDTLKAGLYYVREPDREKAIKLAIKMASPKDIIVITGKGHEKSMNFGNGEISWSDFEVVKKAMST
jgi:UDP-N-acetylmuramoyl-L-alanyl-D-glutamate--2,6-diaminopimelate ligase